MIANLQLWDFFQGTQERVRKSCGKPAISVQAIEVLLYLGTGLAAKGYVLHCFSTWAEITGNNWYGFI